MSLLQFLLVRMRMPTLDEGGTLVFVVVENFGVCGTWMYYGSDNLRVTPHVGPLYKDFARSVL